MNTGLSTPELRKKGWFTPAQLVASPAPGTYTLTPLHAPQSVAGKRILEIPRTDGTWNRLFVAYRATGTIDAATAGVQLHRGKSITDPATTVSADANGAVVRITSS